MTWTNTLPGKGQEGQNVEGTPSGARGEPGKLSGTSNVRLLFLVYGSVTCGTQGVDTHPGLSRHEARPYADGDDCAVSISLHVCSFVLSDPDALYLLFLLYLILPAVPNNAHRSQQLSTVCRKLTKPSQRMVYGRRHRQGLRERQHRRPQNVAGDVWECAVSGADGYVLERRVFQGMVFSVLDYLHFSGHSDRLPYGFLGPPFHSVIYFATLSITLPLHHSHPSFLIKVFFNPLTPLPEPRR